MDRDIRETFEIAHSKAATTQEGRIIDEFLSRLTELGVEKEKSAGKIISNRIARGEKVKPLTASQQSYIDNELVGDDLELDPIMRQIYEDKYSSREILKGILGTEIYLNELERATLSDYFHEEDRSIIALIINSRDTIIDDMTIFIGDSEFAINARREALVEFIGFSSGGGEIYLVLDFENNIDLGTGGKTLAKILPKLDVFSEQLNVIPMSEFLGFGGEQGGDWFPPEAGICALSTLVDHIIKPTTKLSGKRRVADELRQLIEVLEYAQSNNGMFHFEIDT